MNKNIVEDFLNSPGGIMEDGTPLLNKHTVVEGLECKVSDLHPYECNGKEKCIHCDKEKTTEHDPDYCWLCHNGQPPKF